VALPKSRMEGESASASNETYRQGTWLQQFGVSCKRWVSAIVARGWVNGGTLMSCTGIQVR
jgi:hypothetical protein